MANILSNEPKIELLPSSQHGVKATTFQKQCVDFHWHFHPEVELTWVDQGEGILHAGQSIYPYGPKQLILVGANLPHAYGSDPSQRNGAKWVALHFRPSLWGDAFWQLPENNRIQELLVQATCGYIYRGPTAEACAELMKRIEARSPGDMPLARLMDLLELLARDKNGHRLNPRPANSSKERTLDPRLTQILGKLESMCTQAELTQAEVAQWINMSPQTFCRYFQRLTGRRFQHHLNELRIARACTSLLSTEKSIAEIAYESGFNNLSNFNRRFREFTSHTPRTYRKTKGGLHME